MLLYIDSIRPHFVGESKIQQLFVNQNGKPVRPSQDIARQWLNVTGDMKKVNPTTIRHYHSLLVKYFKTLN